MARNRTWYSIATFEIQPFGWNCYSSGVNFTNILQAAFTHADPKSAKKTVKLSSFFALLGSACVKAAHRMLVKLTLAHLMLFAQELGALFRTATRYRISCSRWWRPWQWSDRPCRSGHSGKSELGFPDGSTGPKSVRPFVRNPGPGPELDCYFHVKF